MSAAAENTGSFSSLSRERAFTGIDVANVMSNGSVKHASSMPAATASSPRQSSGSAARSINFGVAEFTDSEPVAQLLGSSTTPATIEVDAAMLPRVVALAISSHVLSQSNPQFVLYVVDVTTTRLQWKIKRRYSQFRNLHQRLLDKGYSCPSFPGRALFNM
jgi:hypothetical protein